MRLGPGGRKLCIVLLLLLLLMRTPDRGAPMYAFIRTRESVDKGHGFYCFLDIFGRSRIDLRGFSRLISMFIRGLHLFWVWC